MQQVTGFGGFFFRADDPGALARWYETHLGVSLVPDNYTDPVWTQQAGPTVFAPFARDSDYFGNDKKQWMLNFRVADLEAMIAQLTAAGITVTPDPQTYPNGRFARLYDPEGNPIELWQPA
ncbi:VOC family protein [Salinimonas lutimaris]|uniref:VOC family protein n=1 Tax=Salinimonas lutimaris TaxID=914153 RepID=UPI0010C02BBC|nr:VOC family protein [Salinimonas lutimaris]